MFNGLADHSQRSQELRHRPRRLFLLPRDRISMVCTDIGDFYNYTCSDIPIAWKKSTSSSTQHRLCRTLGSASARSPPTSRCGTERMAKSPSITRQALGIKSISAPLLRPNQRSRSQTAEHWRAHPLRIWRRRTAATQAGHRPKVMAKPSRMWMRKRLAHRPSFPEFLGSGLLGNGLLGTGLVAVLGEGDGLACMPFPGRDLTHEIF